MKNQEIERKFLVDKKKMPDLSKFKCDEIIQGYLGHKNDKLTTRVRSTNNEKFQIDLKDGGRIKRMELSFNITKEEFDNTLQLCGNKVIFKTRYLVPSEKNGGKILEVDVYNDFDFITCEYEAETEEEVNSLIWEDWFLEELTDDVKYSNKNLAYKVSKI